MRRMLLGLAGLMVAALLGGAGEEVTQAEATGVLGRMVHDSSGAQVGRVVDVVVEPSGLPRAIVVDTGGFMGVGARRVAVAWQFVHVPPPASKDDTINIDLSDDQVKSAPEYTDRTKPAKIVGLPTDPPSSSSVAAPAPAPVPATPPEPPPPAEPAAKP